jgi:hypothetical protein
MINDDNDDSNNKKKNYWVSCFISLKNLLYAHVNLCLLNLSVIYRAHTKEWCGINIYSLSKPRHSFVYALYNVKL